jgi:succinyl-diaminopimelate desuccinylase
MTTAGVTREEVVSLLAAMVAIPSINPALARAGDPAEWAGEGAMAHFVADWLVRNGIEAAFDEVEPGRPNVVAHLPGPPGAPRVVWEGHLDTVQVDGMAVPFTPVVRDGRLYGRGAVDDKASLAMFMLALRAARGLPRNADVTFVAAIDEEVTFRGVSHHIARNRRYDMGIAGEPTDLRIVTACKGVIRFVIEVHGRNAHASRPEEGIDAIATGMGLLAHLRAHMEANPRRHPILGGRTLTCTLFQAGEGPNSVAALARLTFDMRTLPDQTGHDAWEEIAAVVSAFPVQDGGVIDMRPPFIDSISMEVDSDAAVVTRLQPVLRSLGIDPAPLGAPFGSDATKFTRAGSPTVVFGPGSIEQAHSPDEYVEIDQVVLAAEILVRTITAG